VVELPSVSVPPSRDARNDVLLVLTTAPDAEAAGRIAHTLVEERLVACASLVTVGLRSVYRWGDRVHDEAEVLLLCKTTRARFFHLERRLPEIHPYDVPELLALPVEAGLAAYCAWVAAETTTD
jgi:periplasmic divalent cation tolerance protein